jgi:hypothetical protein
MKIAELLTVIQNAGGGLGAADYADALLQKINQLDSTGQYDAMLRQLRAARQFGDFRGRVLEVNFADLFLGKGIRLIHGPRQGMPGDIDFCWVVAGYNVYIEMKVLRPDDATTASTNNQSAQTGMYQISVTDDTPDIGRIQRDIMAKSTIRRFNPRPEKNWINLVAIDLCELQLGMADLGDCLLAAGGNPAALQRYYPETIFRPDVVGVFERAATMMPTIHQMNWLCKYQRLPEATPHPREYIHGCLFLFRTPQDTAALSYNLRSFIVWNQAQVSSEQAEQISAEFRRIMPLPPKRA